MHNVRQVSNDSGDTSEAICPQPPSPRGSSSGGAGIAASCMTLSEYITPRSISPLFDLTCTSSLPVVPISHLEINAYSTPGQLQDVSNRSTIRQFLHLPLELSYCWTRRVHNRYCPLYTFTASCRTHVDDTVTQSLDSVVMC